MSVMTKPAPTQATFAMSDHEFLEFAPERKAELIGGEFILASPASRGHERLFMFLATLLNTYVRHHNLGEVFGSRTAVRLGVSGEVAHLVGDACARVPLADASETGSAAVSSRLHPTRISALSAT